MIGGYSEDRRVDKDGELSPVVLTEKVDFVRCAYTFLYRRRSGYFYVLSSLAGRLTPEMTRTLTIEKSIEFNKCCHNVTLDV
jgi:hypothetical protein